MDTTSHKVRSPHIDLLTAARHSPYRFVIALATVVAAIAHIPVIGPHVQAAPYMGVLFIVLTVALFVLAGAALVRDSTAVYLAVILTCALVIIGYAATRIVAFPQLADDVGNWLEPLGIVSILAEALALTAGLAVLRPPPGIRSSAIWTV